MNFVIVATLAVGLLVDYHWPSYGQPAASIATWIVCFTLWFRSDLRSRAPLLACLVIATTGEVFLSLVWGLYEYRLRNIPLFVPPGHVLLFFLGLRICKWMPDRAAWPIAALALPLVAGFAWMGRDTLSLVLFAFFVACMAASPERKRLYATMFLISMVLEYYGTWIGNWVWMPEVPHMGLTTMNPPIAAGAFYCVLDLLVVAVTRRRGEARNVPEPTALAVARPRGPA